MVSGERSMVSRTTHNLLLTTDNSPLTKKVYEKIFTISCFRFLFLYPERPALQKF